MQIITLIIASGLIVFCQAQDISSYLTDKRFVDKELNCLLGAGDCDGFGQQIKRNHL